MKRSRLLFVPLLCAMSIAAGAPAEYSAVLTVYTHGTFRLRTYRLDERSIRIVKHIPGVPKGTAVVDRPLTAAERLRCGRFFAAFRLGDLQERYIDRGVKGEIHRTYDICIGGECRHSHVYFRKVPSLDDLASLLYGFEEIHDNKASPAR